MGMEAACGGSGKFYFRRQILRTMEWDTCPADRALRDDIPVRLRVASAGHVTLREGAPPLFPCLKCGQEVVGIVRSGLRGLCRGMRGTHIWSWVLYTSGKNQFRLSIRVPDHFAAFRSRARTGKQASKTKERVARAGSRSCGTADGVRQKPSARRPRSYLS